MIGDDKEGVQPWILVPEGPVRDLLFAYEAVLTEMRTWANSDVRIIAEWVRRIDNERDTFVQSQSEKDKTCTAYDRFEKRVCGKPVEPGFNHCQHHFVDANRRRVMDKD